jgi:hypothetical protein
MSTTWCNFTLLILIGADGQMVRKNIQMNVEEIKAQHHQFSPANNLLTSVIR